MPWSASRSTERYAANALPLLAVGNDHQHVRIHGQFFSQTESCLLRHSEFIFVQTSQNFVHWLQQGVIDNHNFSAIFTPFHYFSIFPLQFLQFFRNFPTFPPFCNFSA